LHCVGRYRDCPTCRKTWDTRAPPFGQPRPQAVIDKVGFTVDKIRAAGKIAGTLVTADELPYWLEKGVQFFYVHSDPFLRLGLNGIKKSLGRRVFAFEASTGLPNGI
jgi:hypothetical protein